MNSGIPLLPPSLPPQTMMDVAPTDDAAVGPPLLPLTITLSFVCGFLLCLIFPPSTPPLPPSFSLRSLDRFAPWVRKVYLVTDNQIPKWLVRGEEGREGRDGTI